jgi:purine-binding chemotaxis protein CheW
MSMSTTTAAAGAAVTALNARQYSTFSLGELLLGVEVLQVQELIRHQPMTTVPLAPAEIRGLLNLRGQIVTAIDLRRRLGLDDRGDDRPPMNVVVRTADGVVSLLVDEIGDVVEAADDAYETAPATLTGPLRELVTGVYKLRDQLLLVIDVERTAQIDGEGGR